MLTWRDLGHKAVRDFVPPEGFEKLMEERGVSNDATVVLYGDYNNWLPRALLGVVPVSQRCRSPTPFGSAQKPTS